MECRKCRFYYTDLFSKTTFYCKQIDRYVCAGFSSCPCKKDLVFRDKITIEIKKLLKQGLCLDS